MDPVVGILALQGAFAAHGEALGRIGARHREVRTPADLEAVDALVMPGGESSTMSHLIATAGLGSALRRRIDGGMPVFGTCAGMILLASEILDGRADQVSLGAIDVSVRRNAYGRQVDSFERDIVTSIRGVRGSFHGVFIRAPRIERLGPGVEVLGRLDDEPVLVRQGNAMAASFHPELSGDDDLHAFFVEMAAGPVGSGRGKGD